MTARTLRGLTRRLTKYHSQIANWHYKDEALELASAEIGWLHDEARKRQRKMTPQCTNRVTDISSRTVSRLLIPMVKRRITRHEPIAYIIGRSETRVGHGTREQLTAKSLVLRQAINLLVPSTSKCEPLC